MHINFIDLHGFAGKNQQQQMNNRAYMYIVGRTLMFTY